MPGGRPMLNGSGRIVNRNVIATIDPETWRPVSVVEISECHDEPIVSDKIRGLEDLRLFETETDGLLAVATAMQFNRDGKQEIVVCSFDAAYQVCDVAPLRGLWSKTHQKNWTPYDKTNSVRLLYSVERGGIHDGQGMSLPRHGIKIPPMSIDESAIGVVAYGQRMMSMRSATPHMYKNGSLETKVLRRHPRQPQIDKERTVDTGPFSLRGGSQLVQIAKDRWLGVGHGVRLFGALKFYWHVFYTVCARGILRERSAPFKLSTTGIEFAAGLAYDPAACAFVISFGTDDERAWLGIADHASVMATLQPVHGDAA